MKGRTIKIHLIEGTPNDVMTAEIIASWTGKIILAPRTKLVELAKRPEIQRAGVYILVGDDSNYAEKEQVYIGESENVLVRLKQHFKDTAKDFWKHTIIVISKDEHLTKSLVRYLESRLIQIVKEGRRASLNNGSEPECPKLPESDISDMEYFLQQIQMLLPVMGFSFILPSPSATVSTASFQDVTGSKLIGFGNSPVFQMSVSGTDAKAQEIANEFVVLQGSTARKSGAATLAKGYVALRSRLVEEGKLGDSEQDGFWVFKDNIPFGSTTAAAAVVSGTNLAGPTTWKISESGQTYRDWQEERFNAASADIVSDADEEEIESSYSDTSSEFATPPEIDENLAPKELESNDI